MDKEKNFYPDYLIEILLVIFITIELALILAMIYPQTIGRQIDFSAQFQPKPEWYFLWLYQLMRYFPGRFAFVGTVLMPLLAILILMLIPFIDGGRYGRLKASIMVMVLFLAFIVFTLIPALSP